MSKPNFGIDTVKKVADLARLELSQSEIEKFTAQLGNILTYIEKLNTLDTSKVEAMTNALDMTTPMRADEARPSPGAEAMLGCAPEALYENYKVPQVLGSGN